MTEMKIQGYLLKVNGTYRIVPMVLVPDETHWIKFAAPIWVKYDTVHLVKTVEFDFE